jgi:ABC-type bacteriocin/lantibiotic exporter with double-glycine peptidase domain
MPNVLPDLRRKSQLRRSLPMKRVVQQTGTSCGVACVAMLAHLSYRDAFAAGVALWDQEYWDTSHRTDAAELRAMLAALGWRLGRMVKCRTWSKIPTGALVAVQRKAKTNDWHWVVSGEDAKGPFFFDPRKNVKAIRRREFAKAPPSWYHSVTPL